MVTCVCCGKPLLDGRPDALMEDGPAHFRCWDEHHSDRPVRGRLEHQCASKEIP